MAELGIPRFFLGGEGGPRSKRGKRLKGKKGAMGQIHQTGGARETQLLTKRKKAGVGNCNTTSPRQIPRIFSGKPVNTTSQIPFIEKGREEDYQTRHLQNGVDIYGTQSA